MTINSRRLLVAVIEIALSSVVALGCFYAVLYCFKKVDFLSPAQATGIAFAVYLVGNLCLAVRNKRNNSAIDFGVEVTRMVVAPAFALAGSFLSTFLAVRIGIYFGMNAQISTYPWIASLILGLYTARRVMQKFGFQR